MSLPSRPQEQFDVIVRGHATVRRFCTAPPDEALALLEDLAVMLPEHFDLEERPGGFIARIEKRHPGAAEQLRADHAALRVQLSDLVASHDLEALEGFALALSAHEEREAQLLR